MKRLKITFNAPVVLAFIIISAVATYIGQSVSSSLMSKIFMVYHSSPKDPFTYIRMVCHVFGQSNWQHYLVNATYLLLLGPMLEEKYGGKRIIIVMLVTALVSGLIHYFFFQNQVLCGASGIVFAFILLTSFTGIKKGEIPVTFILIMVIFLGQQIYDGITSIGSISHLSQIIGGVVGCIANDFISKK